jgi:lipoprotein signal peptidase
MSIQSVGKNCLIIALPLLWASKGLCGRVEIYPYEPVVVSVPHQPVHLEIGYGAEVVIMFPNAMQTTNHVCRGHLFGVTNGLSMFLLSALETNVFVAFGTYTVILENETNTVAVLTPASPDSSVAPLLRNMTLSRIVTNCGRGDLDAELKTVCQQVIALAPNGKYATYANAYLAIDDFYASLDALYNSGMAPDLSAIGSSLIALPLPDNLAKWTVSYNKGCVYKMRNDQQNTFNTFTTLTNSIQYSVWTRNADMVLNALP